MGCMEIPVTKSALGFWISAFSSSIVVSPTKSGKSTLQKLNDCPLLIIGGDIHTVEYQNINLVVDDCDEYNQGEWIRLGGTI